ncbi:MAG: hypothetical protein WDZ80_02655 [Candidatus Paceibacterota bacterium]
MNKYPTLIILIVGLIFIMNGFYQLGHNPMFIENINLSISVGIIAITLLTFITYSLSKEANEKSGFILAEICTLIAFCLAYFTRLGVVVLIGGMFLIAGIFFYSFEYKEMITNES